ncbi:hypothetical protein [Alienimonas californiensis]|uniref:Uncharacterized protein n=1 Tax=Alienimonas californiensis TaxID=2527989 RepID=A0A517PES1_9PLAN|nr:hypothetical protein [Alienimonas californiensis]QDT17863.1 hypothetical protein CA12_39990 [Alienimonas californiensis]
MSRPASSAGRLPRSFDLELNRVVEVELAVGDSVQVGDLICTVVDIVNGEVSLRVDPAETDADAAEQVRFAAVAR